MTETLRAAPNGVVLYQGPSLLDHSPVVVIAVGLVRRSKNAKTGNAVQTYILADNGETPVEALRSGGDASICGDCPHRGTTCYVNVAQAPLAIYKAYCAGRYPAYEAENHRELFRGRFVRLGSYGDPAAVPVRVWDGVCHVAGRWAGYSHAWRYCDPRLSRFCMASVETPQQRQEALAAGWRTFRVRLPDQPVEDGEFVCPASTEAGKRMTCAECGACSGTKAGGKNASPVIIFHGPAVANNFRLRAYQATMHRLQEQEAGGRRSPLPVVR